MFGFIPRLILGFYIAFIAIKKTETIIIIIVLQLYR